MNRVKSVSPQKFNRVIAANCSSHISRELFDSSPQSIDYYVNIMGREVTVSISKDSTVMKLN